MLPRPGSSLTRIIALGIAGFVSTASLMPHVSVPDGAPAQTDLLIHFALQGSIGFAWAWGWPHTRVFVVCVLILLALGLEVGQIWVPGRSFSEADLITNAISAAFGAGVAWFMIQRKVPPGK